MASEADDRRAVVRFVGAYFAVAVFMNVVPGPRQRWDKGQVIDKYTWAHVAWGAIAERMGVTAEQLLALSVCNEVGEAVIRRNWPQLTWGAPETPANIALDIGANMAGWELARRL